MKILELTNFSAGIDGVFARVREESMRLAEKGHEIRIFSSNIVKGAENRKRADSEDEIGRVLIKRFDAKILGGESFMKWDFKSAEKEALAFTPDVIIAHSYRHMHTSWALKIGKKIRARVFLVTHAPFGRSKTRNLAGKAAVWFYDYFIGPGKLKKFEKIIAITKWEDSYLKKLGVEERKIEYIPNGIPEEFFQMRNTANEEKKILFFGRVAPIKDIETVLRAFTLIDDKNIVFEITGPADGDYLLELKKIIEELRLNKRVVFSPAVFDIKEKIRKIDSAEIFILPSKSEGMPQSLVEAMARGKIAIASDNLGNKEIIKDGENGFLFRVGGHEECAGKINLVLNMNKTNKRKIERNARKSVEEFSWNNIIEKIENLLKN